MGSSSRGRSATKDSSAQAPGSKHVPATPVRSKPSKEDVEPAPSREGRAQRAALAVEGLKGYQLGDCIGKGAFGSVYRALHWGSGETVAIKQIRLADLPKNELRVIMLEIDLLKNLHHANIVKYHGFVKSTDSLYIILEYCENGSLHSICKNFGKFPENLVALYMSQVIHGLLYLHEQGVIHRDIKGANILTTKEGLVKLADFGVATRTQGLSESSVVGTPYWMAPEVIELSGATTASDIWSLGCTVIELLDGKPPYHKLQPMPALFRIVNDDHPPLPEGASPACRDFLMQCFQKDPNLRVSAKKLLKHPWIGSAKKADSVVPTKPTQFDQAVKSVQEWNEALRSPNNTMKKPSRFSPAPRHAELAQPAITQPGKLDLSKQKSALISLPPAETESDDNWDSDFASSFGPGALRLATQKPQDNFAGQLSHERLKSFASFERNDSSLFSMAEDQKENLMSSSFDLNDADPLQTVRPYTPAFHKLDVFQDKDKRRKRIPQKGSTSSFTSETSHQRPDRRAPSSQRRSSRSMRPPSNNLLSLPARSSQPPRPVETFQEGPEEDFSDLVLPNDLVSQQFQGLSLVESPADAHNKSRAAPPGPQPDGQQMRLSRPAVEIQRFAEHDDEDFSDMFGDVDALPQPEVESNSERGTMMMLNSKLSSGSWLGDDEDEDDPFAQLEEGFDEMDLETQVARDRHARLCISVESLVGSLKTSQPDDVLVDVSEQLLELLMESPELKTVIVSSHGMLPILEILENCQRRDVVGRLLRIVNTIILDSIEIQENLCFVGGIPIISQFALKRYPIDIRLEAAAFVRQMYQTSTLTLQMFISCGGLNVLVEFLEEDVDTERELVLTGVNGIWSVFELQGPTPKNDFCRILSRSTILYPLSLVLGRLVHEDGEFSDTVQARIVNIFLLFSQAENHVKETIADRMVLKRVLKDLPLMAHAHQITMLKFLKNLSMLATTHDSLQNSNAIEALTDFLAASMKSPQFREISNHVLNIMYNLCRLSKTRQEDAALNGIIPLLQKIVQTEWPLKEFALPILCDMAHSGKVGRKLLWQNKGLQFYVSLLADKYWQVTALDAIFVWLQEETARVEQHLLEEPFGHAIVDCFVNPEVSADAFENLLEPLQKLLRLSPSVAAHLAHPEIFSRTAQKLHTKKAVVKLNLLRIIKSICDVVPFINNGGYDQPQSSAPSTPSQHGTQHASIIKAYGLHSAIIHLSQNDPAVLVRELASEIIKSSELAPESVGLSDSIGFSGSNLLPHPGSRLLSRQGTLTRKSSGSSSNLGLGLGASPPVMGPIMQFSKGRERPGGMGGIDLSNRNRLDTMRGITSRRALAEGGRLGSSSPFRDPATHQLSSSSSNLFSRPSLHSRLGGSGGGPHGSAGLPSFVRVGSDGSGSTSSRESGSGSGGGLLLGKGQLGTATPGRFSHVSLGSGGLLRERAASLAESDDGRRLGTPPPSAPPSSGAGRGKGLVIKRREEWR